MLGQFGRLLFHHIFVADLANRKAEVGSLHDKKTGHEVFINASEFNEHGTEHSDKSGH
ncbi:Uncharacterised protein [Vibrio cholerae]|nr:Uncharacterised protein [Vibrio cholerae]CSB32526.1 Uncharacterised protein [Vibrio cholerae]CSC57207.1 Uncharacterised protein [Vibrio cholerae]